jgi:prepilin-type N-terminal cleavage/methylation domain-containing protein
MSFTRKNLAFTLVELLAVIVIIGLMLGVGLPAMTKLSKSGELNSAVRHVSSTLSLARQYAITKRTPTRFVFAEKTPASLNITNYYHTAFAVLALTNSASPNSATSWAYISKLEVLPEGTIIDSRWFSATQAGFPHPTNLNDVATLTYIQFSPTGAASSWGSNLPEIIFRQGYYSLSNSATVTTSGNAATCTVETILGRVRVTR